MTTEQQATFDAVLAALTLPEDPTVQVLNTATEEPGLSYAVDTHRGPNGVQSTLRATAEVGGKTYTRVTELIDEL